MKIKDEKEWMFQAEYDMDAAALMYRGGKYVYAVFMCHLSVEKTLKAVYYLKFKKEPPKIHDLSDLAAITNLKIPGDLQNFIDKFSSISVPA